MKAIIVSISLFFACLTSVAQDDYYSPPVKKIPQTDRINASVMAGTSMSFLNGSKRAALSTFIAPKINYKINERLSLNAGLIHYNFSPYNGYVSRNNEGIMNNRNTKHSGNLIFAGADYKLNKKVILSGAVMVDVKGANNKCNNYKAAAFGLDYKLSERSSIGFRATVSQGNPDYMFNPGNNSFQYSPFSNNAFGNTMGGFGQWGADELNRTIR
jgi:hypothetical protein